jgi:simple sugar transport system ATP-binding protein
MLGGELSRCVLPPREPGEILLELTRLRLATADPFGTALDGIDLRVRAGEIVGIAGVSGNGQKELLAALSGETRCAREDRGAVRLAGQGVGDLAPGARRRLGLRYVPEERLGRGAVPSLSLADNALLTGAEAGMVRRGWLRTTAARAFAREVISRFEVRCSGAQAPADSLSGGNLQKFIVGRETQLAPKVLVVAQPTWGVDVGAAQLVHQSLIELRGRGVGLLVVSEELDELFAICDRLAVIAQGRLSPMRRPAETSVEEIGRWMSGAFIEQGHGGRDVDAAA